MNGWKKWKPEMKNALHRGMVIPAHPLALNRARELDEQRQRALTRYYIAAGAGGIAVAVHTTQFEIRDHQLLEPVLRLAAEEVDHARLERPFLKVAGICGPTEQALREAELAASLGYDLGLVSVGGLLHWSEEDLIQRAEKIAQIIPVFGFYLQPSVGGRNLSFDFWKAFADIPGVMAIKIAPFNRYQTLDVVRAVCHSKRCEEIALYTGNDDNIVADLLTTYRFRVDGKWVEKKIAGGLLGHWAVWTKKAVALFEQIQEIRDNQQPIPPDLLKLGVEVTDCNAAFFDAANRFAGCIAGIHEVLRRQGLLEGRWCLNPKEELSPGQMEEIERVYRDYPHLNDDGFVAQNKEQWFSQRNRDAGQKA
ncbi:dihydrodipicolinate synthase family protein [Paenactinomyces guangxiensis]|uniref:Dihydrodipicolinate synthase family protein n=1 Tax=Paenactinomyces guangxiensis TaxID=1490290 RepID=A0A7W1WU91_9BACL|nr:dihydrodipicolinate synthase family protein [Paenactinomyces guangxiensis]MBA4496093.1 dihydrodipicolinate synthase family protein [Paenactinomyces guangxiensis]MBH8593180.1 dihydrodipicolinate synthase family protein [Paenactinomyces guangxiensis]